MSSNKLPYTKNVHIIGAGIVGLCCALHLQRDGWQVTLIDKVGPGESCSFGHAGVLSETSALPNAMPGVMVKVPKWLLDPEGPLYIRFRYLPKLLPWLLRFLKAGTASESENTVRSLLALNAGTVEKYQTLVNGSQVRSLIRPSGYLNVYQNESSFKHASRGWELLRRHGAQLRMLSGEELHELEPTLSPSYSRAVLIENQGFTTNPFRLVQVLSENPARIFGLYPQKGTIAPGSDADLVVFDPAREFTIRAENQHSNAGYTLYEGRTVLGWPEMSFQRGRPVLRDGEIVAQAGQARFLPTNPAR
jgi:glycine/D-amino acid oxidase-like deaminating enzyme